MKQKLVIYTRRSFYITCTSISVLIENVWRSEVIIWRTDNTMVKRKKTKNNNDLQNLTQKSKYEQHEPPYKLGRGWTQVLRRVNRSCSKRCTLRVTVITHPVISHEWGKDLILYTYTCAHEHLIQFVWFMSFSEVFS